MSTSRRKQKVKSNYLSDIYRIQAVLKQAGYLDISRISQEIYEYCDTKGIKRDKVLKRIMSQEPWEYIKGYTNFHGFDFNVSKDVLIPRVESEKLVEIAIKEIKRGDYKEVVDVGTGSGCLILSVMRKVKNKNIEYKGLDISKKALDCAKGNDTEGKVTWIKSNLLNAYQLSNDTLLLANLPYIPTAMYIETDKSVKDYEPKIALDGGEDGVKYYRALLEQIEKSKRKNISLIIEIEPSTLETVKKVFSKYNPSLYKDIFKRNRFLLIHLS